MCDSFVFEKTIIPDVTKITPNQMVVDANDNALVLSYTEGYSQIVVLSLATGEILDTINVLLTHILAIDIRDDGRLCAYSRNNFDVADLLIIDPSTHNDKSYPITVQTATSEDRVILKVLGNKIYLAISGEAKKPMIYVYETVETSRIVWGLELNEETLEYLGTIEISQFTDWDILDIAFNEKAEIIYVLCRDGRNTVHVQMLTIATYEYLGTLPDELVQEAKSLAYSSKTKLLAIAADNEISFFDGTEQAYMCALEISKLGDGWIRFTHRGNLLVYHDFGTRVPNYLDIFSNVLPDPAALIKSAAKR